MPLVTLVLVLACLSFAKLDFSIDAAKKWLDYSGASYCCESLGQDCGNWSCNACRKQPGLTQVQIFHDVLTGSQGFTGFDPATQSIIVGVAGTNPFDIRDVATDLATWPTSFSGQYGCPSSCQVHAGFLAAWKQVESQILATVSSILQKTGSRKIVVVGHSQGAAVAALGALSIKSKFGIAPDMFSFGKPRVGNPAFQQYFDSLIQHWRVTYKNDIITTVPPTWLGYRHTGVEVHFTDATHYQILTDKEDSDGTTGSPFWTLNVIDHLEILGFSFTANLLTCRINYNLRQSGEEPSDVGLSQGAKIGIGVGVGVGVLLVLTIVVVAFVYRSRVKNPEQV